MSGRWDTVGTYLQVIAIAASVSTSGIGFAQGADEQTEREQALELFREGATEYDNGNFARAADLFRQANELFAEPILMYNYARALESLGDLDGARDAYVRYLESEPDDARSIEARVNVLDERIDEQEALEAAAAAATSDPVAESSPALSPEPRPNRAPAVGVAVAGAVLTALGATLATVGRVQTSDANDEERNLRDAVELHDQGLALYRSGLAVGAIGITALVTGLIWWALNRQEPASDLALLRW